MVREKDDLNLKDDQLPWKPGALLFSDAGDVYLILAHNTWSGTDFMLWTPASSEPEMFVGCDPQILLKFARIQGSLDDLVLKDCCEE